MCAGKDHATDKLHQPIAAAHAAAFAFSILSFRSKVPTRDGVVVDSAPKQPPAVPAAEDSASEECRVKVVFNFEGSKEEWSKEKVGTVVKHLQQAIGDEKLTEQKFEVLAPLIS